MIFYFDICKKMCVCCRILLALWNVKLYIAGSAFYFNKYTCHSYMFMKNNTGTVVLFKLGLNWKTKILIISGPLKIAWIHLHQHCLSQPHMSSHRCQVRFHCPTWRSNSWMPRCSLMTLFMKQTNFNSGYDFPIISKQKTFPDGGTFTAVILLSFTLLVCPPEETLKEGGMPAVIRKEISKAPWQQQRGERLCISIFFSVSPVVWLAAG